MTMRSTSLAILVVLALCVPVGTVSADDHGPQKVTIATQSTVSTDSNISVKVNVTNPATTDLVSPIIEIPLGSGLAVPTELQSTSSGTTYVDGVTVSTANGTEPRTAFINDSTFRPGTQALYIEGVEVPAGESRVYNVTLRVTGTSETTLEADARPLNNESQNVRNSTTIQPVAEGTLNATVTSGNTTVTISGNGVSDSATGSVSTSVPGNANYTVSAALPVINGPLTLSDIHVGEYETKTVEFINQTGTDSSNPVIIAKTGGQAEVVDGSVSRTTTLGTATSESTQQVTFDLSTSGGQTVVRIAPTRPTQAINQTTGVDNSSLRKTVATVRKRGETDSTLSVEFKGYYLGDVNTDQTVNSSDAASIANGLVAGETQSDDADVNNDGEVTVVDAMLIQQYSEGNRTADYSSLEGET